MIGIFSTAELKRKSYKDIEDVLRGTRGGIMQDRNDLLEQLRNPTDNLIIRTTGFYAHHMRIALLNKFEHCFLDDISSLT